MIQLVKCPRCTYLFPTERKVHAVCPKCGKSFTLSGKTVVGTYPSREEMQTARADAMAKAFIKSGHAPSAWSTGGFT